MATLAKRYNGGGTLALGIVVIVVPTAIGIGIIAWIWICCRRKSRRKALLKAQGLQGLQRAQPTQDELEEQLLTPEEKERRRKEKMAEGYKESSPFVYEYLQRNFGTTTTSQEVLPETSESRERRGSLRV